MLYPLIIVLLLVSSLFPSSVIYGQGNSETVVGYEAVVPSSSSTAMSSQNNPPFSNIVGGLTQGMLPDLGSPTQLGLFIVGLIICVVCVYVYIRRKKKKYYDSKKGN